MPRDRAKAAVKDPPDDHIATLRGLAEAAGDEELVQLCGAALRDYATARDVIAREIAAGPLAEAFSAALRATGTASPQRT